MEEFIGCVILSLVAAALITPIANYGFDQHLNFFVVWIVAFCLCFLGLWIAD
ncbi:membrane protein [Streptomyces phage Emma1919]|uniref:Uncharacterized protein n=2 Tax=Gilsonvirus gilson TaxID=2846398 RepID=A0A3Q9R4Z2_9CAUD|nr:membrane protein [Streptomyces phage Gilson]QQV92561.1 membrane protein [Streptomyces phage MeganTheeKilla]QZE11326.1 membrane protein [Streptomyces phage Forrest]QZE11554.1 membrane protein [Streptomyces phage Jada]URQ04803.1 membrane protein [Streptomyces phage Emma1919]AZU97264.1 hypothetical protein SEA_GILSON_219 [Streptomyces phage Gilson]